MYFLVLLDLSSIRSWQFLLSVCIDSFRKRTRDSRIRFLDEGGERGEERRHHT